MGYFMGGTPAQAPIAMARAVKEKDELSAVTAWNASLHLDLEQRYFDARRTGFGCGYTRNYAGAWHDAFELITDRGDELVLRSLSICGTHSPDSSALPTFYISPLGHRV